NGALGRGGDEVNSPNPAVRINQGTASALVADISTGPAPLPIPGSTSVNTQNLTAASTDPTHSCSGSKDFKTAWWAVTPNSSGSLRVLAFSRRTDISGNSGLVLTAYPASQLGNEIGCSTVPRDTRAEIDAVIVFPVTAGNAYWI